MADDAVGPGPAPPVERSNFEPEIVGGGAWSSKASRASQQPPPDEKPASFVRGHQRKAAKSPGVANDDRRAESPTQWEDVEEARATRVRRASARRTASGTRTSSSARQTSLTSSRGRADLEPAPSVPRSTPSSSSVRGCRRPGFSAGASTPPAEADGDRHYYIKSTAAQHRDRASPQPSHRSGSGVDLGANNPQSRRHLRHKHSSLHRRADALAQLSSPSLLSVFSSLTSLTHSSSGSNSTVTQKSYDRSQGIRKRKHSSKHRGDSGHRGTSSKRSESRGSAKLGERPQRRRRRSSQPPAAARQPAEPGPSILSCAETSSLEANCCPATDPRKPFAGDRDRVNSDSGISVRDSSPERGDCMDGKSAGMPWGPYEDDCDEEDRQRQFEIDRLTQELQARDPQVGGGGDRVLEKQMAQEEQLRRYMMRSPMHHHARDEPRYSHNDDADSPRGPTVFPYYYYNNSQPQPGPYWARSDPPPPPVPHAPAHDPGYHAAQPYGNFQPPPSPHGRGSRQLQAGLPDLTKTTITGYERLAFALAETSTWHDGEESGAAGPRPLYRRFEYLNHRILLHIQDELAELEEKLRGLDECIAQQQAHAVDEVGKALPASRRYDSRYGTDLHQRRTLLLGEIYCKLGQYSNAIHSFGKMLSVLEPARADDVSAYESWIREHAPIDENETRFLTRQTDLMSLHRRHKRQERPHEVIFSGDQVLQTALLALLLFLVLPLIAFPQIPSVGGRLFILTIIGAAEVAMVSSTRFSRLMSGKEWRICGIAYFALMAVIAGVV
ncbi:hypothetical protein DIS24_g3440 [Lasiodiplodia hormozganensis]|uniref:DUF6594 domain-containing protein n=1 Tax=Lasiodiplodia hormozganensis TaxID=869390 RepID=A0AA40D4P2_9PEZI|nr:hypothetical protein DIS24_g3440 [Lasiodiplodia hormozganensis]